MPSDHGLRRDNNEKLLPSRPEPASGDPKDLAEEAEFGFGMRALQHRELLPEGQIIEEQVLAWAKAVDQCTEPKPKNGTWATVIADLMRLGRTTEHENGGS